MGPMDQIGAPQGLLAGGVGGGGPMAGPGPMIPPQLMAQQGPPMAPGMGGGLAGMMQNPRVMALIQALRGGGGGLTGAIGG